MDQVTAVVRVQSLAQELLHAMDVVKKLYLNKDFFLRQLERNFHGLKTRSAWSDKKQERRMY